jgi:hypothetical protein
LLAAGGNRPPASQVLEARAWSLSKELRELSHEQFAHLCRQELHFGIVQDAGWVPAELASEPQARIHVIPSIDPTTALSGRPKAEPLQREVRRSSPSRGPQVGANRHQVVLNHGSNVEGGESDESFGSARGGDELHL